MELANRMAAITTAASPFLASVHGKFVAIADVCTDTLPIRQWLMSTVDENERWRRGMYFTQRSRMQTTGVHGFPRVTTVYYIQGWTWKSNVPNPTPREADWARPLRRRLFRLRPWRCNRTRGRIQQVCDVASKSTNTMMIPELQDESSTLRRAYSQSYMPSSMRPRAVHPNDAMLCRQMPLSLWKVGR